MKTTSTPDIDLILDRAVADGRRRRALAGMQDAANRRLARYCRADRLRYALAACLALALPLLSSAHAKAPTARHPSDIRYNLDATVTSIENTLNTL